MFSPDPCWSLLQVSVAYDDESNGDGGGGSNVAGGVGIRGCGGITGAVLVCCWW